MKKLRIYLDTSVIGGCFDREFDTWSNALIEDFRVLGFQMVLSDVTAAEVALAPDVVRDLHKELVTFAEILSVTEEAVEVLAHAVRSSWWYSALVFVTTCSHIALATVAAVDVVVSWNFQHIVRLDKIQLFNGINVELGYKALAIYSPREVTTYGREH